jgi:hypothetical protein
MYKAGGYDWLDFNEVSPQRDRLVSIIRGRLSWQLHALHNTHSRFIRIVLQVSARLLVSILYLRLYLLKILYLPKLDHETGQTAWS